MCVCVAVIYSFLDPEGLLFASLSLSRARGALFDSIYVLSRFLFLSFPHLSHHTHKAQAQLSNVVSRAVCVEREGEKDILRSLSLGMGGRF